MSDVFISYSRLDKEFVGKLRDALVTQTQEVWIDWESIPPSQLWWSEIQKGIARANNFVVVLSPNSLASPICQLEIEYARQLGKRIIPILHIDYNREESIKAVALRLAAPDQDTVRDLWGNRQPHEIFDGNEVTLKHINYFYFRPEDDFSSRFTLLFQVIRTDYAHKEQHTTLQLRALEWLRHERNASFLLLEDELALAESWLEQSGDKEPQPTDLQREYIKASAKRTRQIRNTRRMGVIWAIAALLAFLFAIGALLAGVQANASANQARIEVINANTTLTPLAVTLDAANIQVLSAAKAQSTAENSAAVANTLAFNANKNLTEIPPTLTQIVQQVQEAQTSVASLKLAGNALSLFSSLRVGSDAGTDFVEVKGPIDLTSPDTNIDDLALSCRVYSEEGGFQIHLRESPAGSILLDFAAGNLRVQQLPLTASKLGVELPVENVYGRNSWLNFSILFVGNQLKVYVNNRNLFDQVLVDAPGAGAIRFTSISNDVFRLDRNCVESLADNRYSVAFGHVLNTTLNRPKRPLLDAWDESFDDNYRTKDWWQGGIKAIGEFRKDADGKTYLRMSYQREPTFRLMNNNKDLYMFGAGTDSKNFSDSTDISASVAVRLTAGMAYIVTRASENINHTSLNGYYFELTSQGSGSYKARIRYTADGKDAVYYDATLPSSYFKNSQGWVNILVITYRDELAFFIEGELITAVSYSDKLGGTVALGVGADSTADFDSLLIRDTSPIVP